MGARVTLKCLECGKKFDVVPSRAEKAKFCSQSCAGFYNARIRFKDYQPFRKPCQHCGRLYAPRRGKRKTSKFCSRECFSKWNTGSRHHNYNSVIVQCVYCDKPVKRPKRYVETYENLFCDDICRGKWMSENLVGENHQNWNSVETECAFCGKKFYCQPNRIERSEHNFCSPECNIEWQIEAGIHRGENNPRWKGGLSFFYGENWQRQRKKARKRDNRTCQNCGITEGKIGHQLDVHHIVPFCEFGTDRYKKANRLSNLICLCRSCHMQVENGTLAL